MRLVPLTLAFVTLTTVAMAAPKIKGGDTVLIDPNRHGKILVHDRILATVAGKPISVIDLQKKLDMTFYKQYPQYADSIEARQMFYSNAWRHALQDSIDRELIVADAADVKLEVSNGDIRQEMDSNFGPNIMATLDQMGMTYEEAWELTRADILFRRMMIGRVNMRAMTRVSPAEIRKAYDEHIKTLEVGDEWQYQVLSLRGKDPTTLMTTATMIREKLVKGECPMANVPEILQGQNLLPEGTTLKVSETFHHTHKTVSPAYKDILATMAAGTYSEPIAQNSRDGTAVCRIFFLENKTTPTTPSIQELETMLRNKLMDKAVANETTKYLEHLRSRFKATNDVIEEMIPENFQPFTLIN